MSKGSKREGPRVVLIPGLMGSALRDTTRAIDHQQLCKQHWDAMPRLRDSLESRGNVLCGDDSDLLWGRFQFLHWIADIKKWLEILSQGDGYEKAGEIEPKGLTEMVIQMGAGRDPYEFRPYASLTEDLEKARADLLVFPFDWRLRVNLATSQLNEAVLDKWFGGRVPDRPLAEREKVLLIGHSLGGLVARLFVEDPTYAGSSVVRHAIMVATPSKGAPNAFGYFTGAKEFFQDSRGWKALEFLQSLQPRKPTPNDPAPVISVDMVSDEEQQRLVECFTSIIQLFPTYDFVHPANDPNGRKKQKYTDTYGTKRHTKTSKKLIEILEGLDGPLRDGKNLDAWLARFDITYDFVASTKHLTNTGMVESKKSKSGYEMQPEKKGDRTVPTFSSLDWIRHEKTLRAIHFHEIETDKLSEHPEMCRHPKVRKLCLSRLRDRPRIDTGLKGRMERGNIKQYDAIAREIFRSRKAPFATLDPRRTRVVCYALINGVDDRRKLFNTETQEVNGQTRLAHPLKGIDSTAVVYDGKMANVKYRYVLLPTESDTPAGVLFLPEDGEGFVHLFGIISMPWDPCVNKGHAEMQFYWWFRAQQTEPEWQNTVASIFLWNESLTGEGGFSPCTKCCDDLATLWRPSSVVNRYMHWNTLFAGGETCGRGTTKQSLDKMRGAGWQVYGPMPN